MVPNDNSCPCNKHGRSFHWQVMHHDAHSNQNGCCRTGIIPSKIVCGGAVWKKKAMRKVNIHFVYTTGNNRHHVCRRPFLTNHVHAWITSTTALLLHRVRLSSSSSLATTPVSAKQKWDELKASNYYYSPKNMAWKVAFLLHHGKAAAYPSNGRGKTKIDGSWALTTPEIQCGSRATVRLGKRQTDSVRSKAIQPYRCTTSSWNKSPMFHGQDTWFHEWCTYFQWHPPRLWDIASSRLFSFEFIMNKTRNVACIEHLK